jgi:hypothetical protein
MVLNPESKYPNRRAYVLKLRRDAAPHALTGRIENFLTGQQREFANERELLEFLVGDLAAAAADRAPDGAQG